MKILLIVLLSLIFLFITLIIETSGAIETSIKINDKNLTLKQYNDLKTLVISKFETKNLTYNDGEDWKAIVNKEIKKCEGWEIKNIKNDLLEKLNQKLKTSVC